MPVPELEKKIGIEVYATRSKGIGGAIRRSVEDFVVEEVLVDGSRAEVNPPEKMQKRSPLGSSPTRDRYLLCVLVKRDWDTLSAVSAIADQIGMRASCFHIAGIKDAKAVTAQHITIEGASVKEAENVRIRDIEVRPVGYFRHRLSSYYSLGNRFRIAITSMSYSEPTIRRRIARTSEELRLLGGAPNFFGHQRFGTARPITHLVGREILRGNLREAALLFLSKPSPHEHPESRQAREHLQSTRDFERALKEFPKQLRYERLMLSHLAGREEDYAGAFRELPAKLRELFPQAYQAYLFNRFLSGRLANGFELSKVEVGDTVLRVDRTGLSMTMMSTTATAESVQKANDAIQSGRMRLALPLIGYRQSLSKGAQGGIESQILKEEATSIDFGSPVMPEARLRGELRTATTPMIDFSLDEVSCDPADQSRNQARIGFLLHRGSYATVVLREMMKPCDPMRAGF